MKMKCEKDIRGANVNGEMKSSTPERNSNLHSNSDPNKQIDLLRHELLSCPDLDPDCEAMQLALASLEDVRAIVGMQVQMQHQYQHQQPAIHPSKSPMIFSAADPAANSTSTSTSSTATNDKVKTVNSNAPSRNSNVNTNANANINKKKSRSIIKILIRTLLVDLPLITLFVASLSTGCLSLLYKDYLGPQLDYMKYTDKKNRTHDLTYYHRVCPLGQMSTTDVADLYIGDDFTTDECVEHMMVHGASLYKNIISKETAKSLREYIVQRNKNLKPKEEIGVLENENRWSFGIGANDHPSVADALNEIGTHGMIRPALEKIAGVNPGLVEMTAITAAYGATDQFWHPDVISMGSPAKYARNFLPSYSLFITLQDTTAEMGATGVCPGTYQCGNEDATDTCETYGYQVANDENVWTTGTGLLMNQQGFHRGAAHIDPNAPDRVVFIVSFSPKRLERGETRMLGQGGSYSTRWDMWGHTLNDLENAPTAIVQPWSTLRALGMYKPKNADWGWDFISQMSMRCATFGTGFESVEEFKDTVTIPKMLLIEYEKKMSFSDYFRACIESWKAWALFVNKIAVASYLTFFSVISVVALAFNTSFSKSVFKAMFWSSIRVTMQYTFVAFLSFCIYEHCVERSPWAQEIRDGRYMRSPYGAADKLESLAERGPIVIDESSILITDRFNFKFLNALIDSPKYHPGNMKLHSEIQGADKTFDFLNQEDRAVLADTIVDNAIGARSNFVVHNHDAIWVPLTLDEAKSYVTKELYLQNSPLLASLEKEASFLLSTNRYGSSVMARRFSVVNINTLMDEIYATAYVPTFDIYRSAKKLDAKKSSRVFVEKSKPRSVSVFNLLKSNLIEILRHKKKRIGKASTTDVPRTPSHNKTSSTAQTLKVGDTVEGQYNGMYDEWYKGKIIKIYQGAIIDVKYTDGDVDYGLGSANVRKFVPYQVGEAVDASYFQDEEYIRVRIIKKTGTEYVVRTKEGDRVTVKEFSIRRFV